MDNGIVLDIERINAERLCKIVCLNERSETGIEAYLGLAIYGQEFAVPPEIFRPLLDLFSGYCLCNAGVIIRYFKRTKTELTDINGVNRIFPAAFPAFTANRE